MSDMDFNSLTTKQQNWVKQKASWERMTTSAVLSSYTIPGDDELTPCGVYGCYGCPVCKKAEPRNQGEINQLAQTILESATTKEEHELYSQHEDYEYEISRDNENESWYIQVRAADGGHLYDGWWKDSEDETLEAAVREAIDGAQILEDE